MCTLLIINSGKGMDRPSESGDVVDRRSEWIFYWKDFHVGSIINTNWIFGLDQSSTLIESLAWKSSSNCSLGSILIFWIVIPGHLWWNIDSLTTQVNLFWTFLEKSLHYWIYLCGMFIMISFYSEFSSYILHDAINCSFFFDRPRHGERTKDKWNESLRWQSTPKEGSTTNYCNLFCRWFFCRWQLL